MIRGFCVGDKCGNAMFSKSFGNFLLFLGGNDGGSFLVRLCFHEIVRDPISIESIGSAIIHKSENLPTASDHSEFLSPSVNDFESLSSDDVVYNIGRILVVRHRHDLINRHRHPVYS